MRLLENEVDRYFHAIANSIKKKNVCWDMTKGIHSYLTLSCGFNNNQVHIYHGESVFESPHHYVCAIEGTIDNTIIDLVVQQYKNRYDKLIKHDPGIGRGYLIVTFQEDIISQLEQIYSGIWEKWPLEIDLSD